MKKYKIIERVWSNGKKDYAVQEYSKKWYSKKYKWRTMLTHYCCDDGCRKRAIFTSQEEAERFIKKQMNNNLRIIRVKDVCMYETTD